MERERVSPAKEQGVRKKKAQWSLVRKIEVYNPGTTYNIDE